MPRKIRLSQKIIISLIPALLFFACGTTKARIAGESTEIKAEAVQEGISLAFYGIPPETSRMFVSFSDIGEKAEIAEPKDIVSVFADIRGAALERIKTEGKIVCPFVQSGHSYDIAVFYETANGKESEKWVSAGCAAAAGTYFSNPMKLSLNENQTRVALSSGPVFSKDVHYAADKYRYGITIKKEDYWSIGMGSSGNGEELSWEFEPRLTEEITGSGYLESGDYPAYASAYCNVVYEDLTWALELAKSEEFIVRF